MLSAGDFGAYKKKIESTGTGFLSVYPEENNDEYHHFYFVGEYEGHETLFDAIVYTLRLEHETAIYELAEEETLRNFPEEREFILSQDDERVTGISKERQEEIGMFMAETILALEEAGEVTVCEHLDLDTQTGFGIGFEAGLGVEKITAKVIEGLIARFSAGTLELDETLVSFQNGGESDS